MRAPRLPRALPPHAGILAIAVAAATVLMPLGARAQAQESANDEYPALAPVELAAQLTQRPSGVKVTVSVRIANVGVGKKGRSYGHIFLDSMEDYRDPRSINVNVFPHAARRLRLDGNAKGANNALVGKTITVHGIAKRVRIDCHAGCPQEATANHYFQTQVFVRDADEAQIEPAQDD